jgi:hypothetical protein
MKTTEQINYFEDLDSESDKIIIQIKGNFRRSFVADAITSEGVDSIPPAWRRHNLSLTLRDFLQSQHPSARGGEDLPDLEEGEREIARLTLVDSVHGEVISLRAKQLKGSSFQLGMVDEYDTVIELPYKESSKLLSSEEVISLFLDCEPNQLSDSSLKYNFQSFFYNDLNDKACKHGVEIAPIVFQS